jgi:hypothetical protein
MTSFIGCEYPDHPHAVQSLICRQHGTVIDSWGATTPCI